MTENANGATLKAKSVVCLDCHKKDLKALATHKDVEALKLKYSQVCESLQRVGNRVDGAVKEFNEGIGDVQKAVDDMGRDKVSRSWFVLIITAIACLWLWNVDRTNDSIAAVSSGVKSMDNTMAEMSENVGRLAVAVEKDAERTRARLDKLERRDIVHESKIDEVQHELWTHEKRGWPGIDLNRPRFSWDEPGRPK